MRELRWLLTHVPVIGCKSHKFPTFAQHLPIASMGLTSRPFASLAPDFDIPSLDSTFHVIPLLAKHVSQSRYIPIPSVDSIYLCSFSKLTLRHYKFAIGSLSRPFPLLVKLFAHTRFSPNSLSIPDVVPTSH